MRIGMNLLLWTSHYVDDVHAPVLEKLVWRISVLEKQHSELVKTVGDILETLSDDNLRLDSDAG